MTVTSNTIANQAIQLIGDNQPPVTGLAPNFDGSAAGKALANLYLPAVQTIMRQFGWDLARSNAALALSGNAAPFPWAFEYVYPANCIQVWQLTPAVLADPNNPLPVQWDVGNTLIAGVQSKVIWANLANAQLVYNNGPDENTWDPLFREAVVRLLASELAIVIGGKPDTAQLNLQAGNGFEQMAEDRGEN